MATDTAYDAQDQGPALLVVIWTLTGITTVMVAVRLFIRTKIIRNLGLDDWLIAFSMVLGLVNVSLTTLAVHHGFGKHSSTIGPVATEKANFIIDIGWIFGILSFAVPKLGIAALLTRILNPSPRVWWMIWGLTGFVGVVAVVNILIFFTSCNPPEALWHPTAGMTCRSTDVIIGYATFNGATSAFTDLALAVYPSMVLWRLQMSLRKKIALCLALGVGTVSACAAIIKITHLKALADVTDATYGSWSLVMWTNVEADLVVLGSCIPTLQPLLELILGKRSLGSSSHPQSYPYDSTNSRPKRSQLSRRTQDTLQLGSEENILPVDSKKESSGMKIQRTDHVVVEYEMHRLSQEQRRDNGAIPSGMR